MTYFIYVYNNSLLQIFFANCLIFSEFFQVFVIYNYKDTDIGSIRVRAKGNAGSHNGMKSMINELNSVNFPRIRIGVGRPKDEFDKIDYVIGHVADEEYVELQKGQDKAVDATICYIKLKRGRF